MSQPYNPILQAELVHLQRTDVGKSRHWLTVLFGGALALAVLLGSCTVLAGESGYFDSAITYQTYESMRNLLQNVNSVLLVLAFLEHLLLVSQALLMSTNAIVREKAGRTWEPLLLTTIDARQIVNGKWKAILQHLVHEHRWGILLRAAAVFWITLLGARGGIVMNAPDVFPAAASSALIVIYTFANMGLTSALGLLASFAGRSIAAVFRLGILLNLLVILAGFWAAFAIGAAHPTPYFLWGEILLVAATPVDGGLMLAYGLSANPVDLALVRSGFMVLVSLTAYGALIWGALRLARALAVRQNALRVPGHDENR
jgi:hypothetical protein